MKRKASGLVICFALSTLGACTSNAKHDSRRPASLIENISTETALSEVMNEQKSLNEVENLAMTVARIYFRTQDYVRQFDLELETALKNPEAPGARDLMTGWTYATLMASRMLSEAATERIVTQYESLMTSYWEALDKNTDAREIARQLMDFRNSINEARFLTGANRLALQDLAAELSVVPLKTYTEYHGPQARIPSDVASIQDFKSFLFKDNVELAAFVNESGNRADLTAKIQQALANEKVLHRNVILMSPMIQVQLKANSATRAPQAIGPDAGASGNISGENFPKGTWALTFDDGPSRFTLQILANLQSHGLKASFFWLAQNVNSPGAAKYIQAAKAAGMDLNNHSYSHANLVNQGAAGLQREIVTSTAIETQAFGFAPKYFRCPYGSGLNTPRVRSMIAGQNMVHVFWNVDSLDWQDHNPASIAKRVRSQMELQGRGIILFHDIHPQSVTASNMIMDDLASSRWRSRTIDQIVKELNGK